MSTPAFPRLYRLNTIGAPTNSNPGVSSGRAGDLVLDSAGSLYYYTGTGWAELLAGIPDAGDITIQPDNNPDGNGFEVIVNGGNATGIAGEGGSVLISGGSSASSTGGPISIISGQGVNNSGFLNISTRDGLNGGDGGDITILVGDGEGAGTGGNLNLASGDSDEGNPGNVTIVAGSPLAGVAAGGNIRILSGNSVGGLAGNITMLMGEGNTTGGEFQIRNETETNELFSVSEAGGIGIPYNEDLAVAVSPTTLNSVSGRITVGVLGSNVLVVENSLILSASSIVMANIEVAGGATGAILSVLPAIAPTNQFTITTAGNLDGTTFSFIVFNNAIL